MKPSSAWRWSIASSLASKPCFCRPIRILEHISSSIVKDVARHGGDVTGIVPDCVVPMLADALAEERQRKD